MPQPEDVNKWFAELSYKEAQAVMKRRSTTDEVRRLQSDSAARTWWKILTITDRLAIYEMEVEDVAAA